MKRLSWKVGVVIAFGVSGFAAQAEELDYYKLNPMLQALVDAEAQAEETIDFVYPRFDEKFSDLNAERLKYDMSGKLKSPPWQKEGNAWVTGSSTYQSDRSPRHTGVGVTLDVEGHTDVLTLIRYTASIALKKKSPGNPKYETQITAHLKRLAVARSIEEVGELVLSGHRIAKEVVEEEIKKSETELECLLSGPCQAQYGHAVHGMIRHVKETIREWTRVRAQVEAVHILLKSENNSDSQLMFSSDSVDEMILDRSHPLKVGKTDLIFKKESILFHNESFYKMKASTLDQLKKDLRNKLSAVQNGDAGAKSYVQDQFRFALIEYKKAIHGENIH
jgi:hypothetical protein